MVELKIYYLEQDIVGGYDTYSDCVVIAESVDDARRIHPSEFVTHVKGNLWMGTTVNGIEYEYTSHDWISFEDIDKIKVTEIGIANENQKRGVICSSFHAG